MASANVRINHSEAAKLLKSDGVMKELRKYADRIVSSTGNPDDYVVEEWVGRNRARVSVWTDSAQARTAEARDHVLLRALGQNNG